jgi:hypothetical protein
LQSKNKVLQVRLEIEKLERKNEKESFQSRIWALEYELNELREFRKGAQKGGPKTTEKRSIF